MANNLHVERFGCMLDVCGPPGECRDALKMLSGIAWLQEDVRLRKCGTEARKTVGAIGWPLVWPIRLATDTQLAGEEHIGALQEE